MTAAISPSHIGICTSNLEASVRFYTEALGFVLDYYIEEFGEPFDILSELPRLHGRAGFFNHQGMRVELLGYQSPAAIGTTDRRPMNQLGLTHLSFVVADLEAVVARILECGGRAYPETRITMPAGQMIFCTDPDGVRLELWQQA